MMNSVSNRGGFVWSYASDLSEQWGEITARKSQIWVQPPGTTSVGMTLLEIYLITKDETYLHYAERVANALIWGQHPSGGWHYFIDFDPTGIEEYYEKIASNCWGWEEYYHYYGNCTFDDEVTSSATRFLLNLYMITLDPRYKIPLFKALDFILKSQYACGAWPQRFPHPEDYTAYYTYNDDVIKNNIFLLLDAYEKLGIEEYKLAAYRGMDFYILSQLPPPQAGWAQQYSLDMQSAAARTYEPSAILPSLTAACIEDLETFYLITGNRKYLRPIPDALQWLKKSAINTNPAKNFTHATFYEIGSNKPLYAHREGMDKKTGRYWVDYDSTNIIDHYGLFTTIDITGIEKEYDYYNSLTPENAKAHYREMKIKEDKITPPDRERVQTIISTMDERGIWISDIQIPYYPNYQLKAKRRTIKGFTTQTYISNMNILLNCIRCRK